MLDLRRLRLLDEVNARVLKVYGDVEIPVYERVNGDQIVSPVLFKINTSYNF